MTSGATLKQAEQALVFLSDAENALSYGKVEPHIGHKLRVEDYYGDIWLHCEECGRDVMHFEEPEKREQHDSDTATVEV